MHLLLIHGKAAYKLLVVLLECLNLFSNHLLRTIIQPATKSRIIVRFLLILFELFCIMLHCYFGLLPLNFSLTGRTLSSMIKLEVFDHWIEVITSVRLVIKIFDYPNLDYPNFKLLIGFILSILSVFSYSYSSPLPNICISSGHHKAVTSTLFKGWANLHTPT